MEEKKRGWGEYFWWGVILAIGLNSCNEQKQMKDRMEAADANARNALSQIEALSGRVEDLETRLGQ